MDVEPGRFPIHGRKRHANDNLESDQRLVKRFKLLNIDRAERSYVPVNHGPQGIVSNLNDNGESMHLDDTKNRVYIHDLDQELSVIASEEEKLVFLPDIEKKLGKIPESVLTTRFEPVKNSELVLYNVPSSLSVPPEQDNVRRAIIETRARARERQSQEQNLQESQSGDDPRSVLVDEKINDHTGDMAWYDDQNAMELD